MTEMNTSDRSDVDNTILGQPDESSRRASAARLVIDRSGDRSNAEWFVAWFGQRMRYFGSRRAWLIYDGRRWRLDDRDEIVKLAKQAADGMLIYAANMNEDGKAKIARQAAELQRRARLESMIALSKCEVPVTADGLDNSPWLLNVENGTIDLQTGECRPHDPEDMLTKLAPVAHDPAATCPVWEGFVRAVLPDAQTAAFVQRFAGYCLTGQTREQVMVVYVGDGANGKTTFINALIDVLGIDYGMRAARDLVMVERRDGHPTGAADLFGKRMVMVNETSDGGFLDESFVKDLTGSDRIRARYMHRDHFEFSPTHKLVVATNHMPRINWTDHGMSRRLRVVPFTVRFWNPDAGETGPEEWRQDKTLSDRLRAEAPGILNWMIRGCLEWQKDGLRASKQMLDAAAGYKAASVSVERFVSECCEQMGGGETTASELYAAYRAFAQRAGHKPESDTKFGRELTRLGIQKRRLREGFFLGRQT